MGWKFKCFPFAWKGAHEIICLKITSFQFLWLGIILLFFFIFHLLIHSFLHPWFLLLPCRIFKLLGELLFENGYDYFLAWSGRHLINNNFKDGTCYSDLSLACGICTYDISRFSEKYVTMCEEETTYNDESFFFFSSVPCFSKGYFSDHLLRAFL